MVAMTKLYAFQQTSHLTNADYLQSIHCLVDAINLLGSNISVEESRITEYVEYWDCDPDDLHLWAECKAMVCEKYIATAFIVKSNPKRYGALIATLQNNFVSSQNQYLTGLDNQNGGLSYYNNKDEAQGHRRGCGHGGGGCSSLGGGTCGGHGHGQFTDHQHHHDAHPIYEGEEEKDEEDILGGNNGNNNNTHCLPLVSPLLRTF
jgi:hypothetical protein